MARLSDQIKDYNLFSLQPAKAHTQKASDSKLLDG